MSYIVLDIETSGLPEEKLLEIMPEFEPASNLKDPDKIAASIAAKRKDWLASAALDAHRAEVLAVGLKLESGEITAIHGIAEKEILASVIKAVVHSNWAWDEIVGHNLLAFDIPFLCRRMWKHGIKPPGNWINCSPYKADWAFDTMLAWSCGNREQRISLDMLAWHLGVGRKSGTGKDFAATYKTDPKAALDYLTNDLLLTEKCYLKMR